MGEDFDPQPLDYPKLIADGVAEPEFAERPYLPARASVWGVGPSWSGKSIWGLAAGCKLSRRGVRVIYLSQENPLQVELSRLERLRPDPDHLVLYHYAGFDLAIPEHVDALGQAAEGGGLIVLDTLTACWSGDENDNAAIAAFDRDALRPLIAYTGATVLTLDHTGHPQAFVRRDGVHAPRGASAKGQKADVVLVFREEGQHEFSVAHGKNRITGALEPVRQYRVEDDEDEGTLELVEVETAHDRRVADTVEAIVDFLGAQMRVMSKRELRDALKGKAGAEAVDAAIAALDAEDPRRVHHALGQYPAQDGKTRRMHGYWLDGVLR